MRRRLRAVVLGLALPVAACQPIRVPEAPPAPAPAPPAAQRLILVPGAWPDLPGWRDDAAAAVLPALTRSCDRILKLPLDKAIGADGKAGTAADWFGPCGALRRVVPGDHQGAREAFEQWFQPFAATTDGRSGEGTFTGYYEPELQGSLVRKAPFTVPLLARPKDLVTIDLSSFRPDLHEQLAGRVAGGRVLPYPTRAEIEDGRLGDVAQPLAWVEDPVDAHILHIQGSGRITLPDGRVIRLGVAATNGRPFVGIGRVLKERGKLDGDTSMPAIRAWLKTHPGEARALMAENPRYVFYRLVEGDGPIGSEGVPLTPERSLAVDTRFVPLGVPLFLDTVDPAGRPLRRVMVAQDTGAAIKGPVRGDFFWGSGEAAFEQAGRMKSAGRYWLLLPRQRSPKVAALD